MAAWGVPVVATMQASWNHDRISSKHLSKKSPKFQTCKPLQINSYAAVMGPSKKHVLI
jgi:hypothetical protein